MEKWLLELNTEAFWIFHHLQLFKNFRETLNGNEKLKSMNSTIPDWMHSSFTNDLAVAIGRLCDKTARTKSFVKFLEKLRKEDFYLSRGRYVGLYKNVGLVMANHDFDSLAGKGEDNYPVKYIDEDIWKLTKETSCKKIIDFRNQYIAHLAKEKSPPPTYDDMFAAFEIIENVIIKYNLLLTAEALTRLTPTVQGDWKEVFTVPWITPDQEA